MNTGHPLCGICLGQMKCVIVNGYFNRKTHEWFCNVCDEERSKRYRDLTEPLPAPPSADVEPKEQA